MKHLTLILLSIALISCNPFISKEVRKAKRCNNKLERLTEKCPELLNTDTIEVPFEVKVPELVIEHEIEIRIDSISVDSLLCELDMVKEQKDKIRFVTEFIKQNYTLDTLITDSLYNATISIKNGVLSFNIQVKERTIKETIKVEDKKVCPIELSWYDKLLIYATKYWWLLILAALIYVFIKFGIKLIL